MSDMAELVRKAAAKQAAQSDMFREILIEAYGLQQTEDNKPEPGFMAYGLMAVDVGVRIANMFMSLKHNTGVHSVMCDLTYNLNVNDFWNKNAPMLMPLIHAALNAHTDAVLLQAERIHNEDYQSNTVFIDSAKVYPLEIFAMIGFLIGGPELMHRASIPVKQALAPYFLS